MAQTKKEHINQAILKIAEDHLIMYGYEKMSMRKIASEVSVSVSNLYNYYKNKAALIEAVVGEIYKEMMSIKMDDSFLPAEMTFKGFMAYLDQLAGVMLPWIRMNRHQLIILLSKAGGSQYENFRRDFTNKYVEFEQAGIALLNDDLKDICLPSDHFIKQMIIMYFNTVETYLLEDKEDTWLNDHIIEINKFLCKVFLS